MRKLAYLPRRHLYDHNTRLILGEVKMEYEDQKECPSCGTIIEEGEVECPSCGENFIDEDEPL